MNATPLENLLARLGNYRPSGKGYTARCPAHEDRQPSLSVNETEDGTVLVKCHAGCSVATVLAALQLELKDLFPPRHEANGKAVTSSKPQGKKKTSTFASAAAAVAALERQHGKRTGFWTYCNADGAPVGAVVRWNRADGTKDIRPVALHSDGWHIAAMPAPRPLYRLPELLQSTGHVLVVEGEKTADAAQALGFTVTTSAGGAKAAARSDWAPLAGRDVSLFPDNNDPGRGYVQQVAAILMTLQPPSRVRVVELPGLPEAGDIVDYVQMLRDGGLADTVIRAEIETHVNVALVLSADKPKQLKAERAACTPVLVSLADVQPRPVSWLWGGRIPLGKVSLLVGDPGLGKSFVTIDMAARVSRGASWPDAPGETNPAGGVILLNAEDDIADTVRPRLDAAGADVTRIQALQAVQWRADNDELAPPRSFSLAADLPALEAAIKGMPDCRLVVIDPISAYLGDADSHNNADIRGLLAPLAEMAGKYCVAVLLVSHLNKCGTTPAVYRITGSLAFAAAARAVWVVAKDKENPTRRLVLPVKMNLAADVLGLAYVITSYGAGGAAVVTWDKDPVGLSADDALETKQTKGSKDNTDHAQTWLRDALQDGSLPSCEVLKQGKENGFNQKQLRKALDALGGKPVKSSFGGGWQWCLPSQQPAPGGAEDAHEDSQDSRPPERESWESSAESSPSSDDDEWGIVA